MTALKGRENRHICCAIYNTHGGGFFKFDLTWAKGSELTVLHNVSSILGKSFKLKKKVENFLLNRCTNWVAYK